LHFSNVNSHRGTTHTFGVGATAGPVAGKAGAVPVAKAPRRSITALDISSTPLVRESPDVPANATGPGHPILAKPHKNGVQSATDPSKKSPPWGVVSLLESNS
jgi:hypothetical protein